MDDGKGSALVLGGGFAGVEAAIQLRKAGLDTTLVSDRDFILINPITIWVPTGELPLAEATLPLAHLARAHGFQVQKARVNRIEASAKRVHTDVGALPYENLVVALGGAKLRPRGVEHTRSICGGTEELAEITARVQALVERGQGHIALGFGGNPKDGSAMRGGPVFELLFNLNTMLRKRGLRDRFELTFFAPMEKPGQRMGEGALELMETMFQRHRIHRRVGVPIAGFDERGVSFADGSRLDADLVLFTPGLQGHPALQGSDLPLSDAGFVRVDEHCQVEGSEDVWAVGDTAALDGPQWRAKQGHVAEVMGRVAAHNVAARVAGRAERESYVEHVGILCVMDTGDGAAWVQRDGAGERMVPMPVFGHWIKKAWGSYWKLSRQGKVPRLPGM
jgi:sulfide:quinone oxidoreductase